MFNAQFNRIDICEAYYQYATDYHDGQDSDTYKIFGRLHKIGFKPSILRDIDDFALPEFSNAAKIYYNLLEKNNLLTYGSLDDMIRSNDYDRYIGDRLGNDLFINDPDRADRIHEYAENGSDGSTHDERISDWRDFLDCQDNIDPVEKFFIMQEINDCEKYHEEKGTLDNIIG